MVISPLEPDSTRPLKFRPFVEAAGARCAALALDETVRRFDADGHLRVTRCILSAAGVSPYRGSEIPDYHRLGLDPQRIYAIYRPADELAKAATSFDGKPILASHCPINATHHPHGMTIGAVGHAAFENGQLVADLTIWDGSAILSITSGTHRSVSAGYRYRVTCEEGSVDGCTYCLRMMDIQFNHLALVEKPRVPQAVIGDHALCNDATSPRAAADISTTEVERDGEGATSQNHDPKDEEKARPALQDDVQTLARHIQAALVAQELHIETPLHAIQEWLMPLVQKRWTPEDAQHYDPERQITERSLPAVEQTCDDTVSVKEMQDAVRAERMHNQRAEHARLAVRPLVGDVSGLDDAEDIYRYALRQIGVPADAVDASALPALIALAGRVTDPSQFTTTLDAYAPRPLDLSKAQIAGSDSHIVDHVEEKSILFGIPVPKKL